MASEWLLVGDVYHILGCESRDTIRRKMATGVIPAKNLAGPEATRPRWATTHEWLDEYQQRGRTDQVASVAQSPSAAAPVEPSIEDLNPGISFRDRERLKRAARQSQRGAS